MVADRNQIKQRLIHQCACHALLSSDFDTNFYTEISNHIVSIPWQGAVLIFLDGAFGRAKEVQEYCSYSSGIQGR